MIRRARLGARSRARVKAGGKLAQGRPSVSLARWREIVAEVKRRAGGKCEVGFGFCWFKGKHPHHVIPRSAGGADSLDNIIWLCAWHHQRVDAPYADGRLVIRSLGFGVFHCQILRVADKFAARGQG